MNDYCPEVWQRWGAEHLALSLYLACQDEAWGDGAACLTRADGRSVAEEGLATDDGTALTAGLDRRTPDPLEREESRIDRAARDPDEGRVA